MGNFSRDVGATFEQAIANRLLVLRQQNIVARFQHNTPTWRKRGSFYHPTVPSGADFSGVLWGGLAFAAECKSTGVDKDTKRLKEFVREDRIPQTQLDDLELTARAGGLSVLVLQFRPDLAPWSIFVVPWLEVPWRLRKVYSSVSAEALEPWRAKEEHVLFEHHLIRSEKGFQIISKGEV